MRVFRAPVAEARVEVERQSPPSTYAVAAFLEREPGALVRMAGVTAIRSAFIFPGMWAASRVLRVDLPKWQLGALTLGSSITITLGMLAWYYLKQHSAVISRPPAMTGA